MIPLSPSLILRTAAGVYGLTPEDLISGKRSVIHVRARWIAMALFREFRPTIAKIAIGRHLHLDHTTVIYALRKIEKALTSDSDFSEKYAEAAAAIRSGRPILKPEPPPPVAAQPSPSVVRVPIAKPKTPTVFPPGKHDGVWQEYLAERRYLKDSEEMLLDALRKHHPDLEGKF